MSIFQHFIFVGVLFVLGSCLPFIPITVKMTLFIILFLTVFWNFKVLIVSPINFLLILIFITLVSFIHLLSDLDLFPLLFSFQGGAVTNFVIGLLYCSLIIKYIKHPNMTCFNMVYSLIVSVLLGLSWFLMRSMEIVDAETYVQNPFSEFYQYSSLVLQFVVLYVFSLLIIQCQQKLISQRKVIFLSVFLSALAAFIGILLGSNSHLVVILFFQLTLLICLRKIGSEKQNILANLVAPFLIFSVGLFSILLGFDSYVTSLRVISLESIFNSLSARLEALSLHLQQSVNLVGAATPKVGSIELHAHNYFVFTLVEYGVLPFLVLFLFVVSLTARIYSLRRVTSLDPRLNAIVTFYFIIFIFYFFVLGPLKDTVHNSMLWIFLGFYTFCASFLGVRKEKL